MNTKFDLLITGIGGQGNILAGDVVCEVAVQSGLDVKKTDTLGMAQRGGSVISHIRIASKVYAPLIQEGEVDILAGFEKLEAVRWANYLKPGGVAIVNNFAQPPLSVNLGTEHYPSDKEIIDILRQRTDCIFLIDGTRMVTALGNIKTLNIFMLGCIAHFLPFKKEDWQAKIKAHLPSKLHEINTRAFALGMEEINRVHVG